MTDDELYAAIKDLGDNASNLSRLTRQTQNKLGVIPFVGAGLSIPFGFKGWGAFLLEQASNAGCEPQVRELIDAGKYEEAGEMAFNARGHRAFLNSIDAEFGDDKINGKPLGGAVSVLPRIALGPVITTNFDHVLENIFERVGHKFERVVWGAKATGAHVALTQDKHFLLKLHGDVNEQTDRVLTRADYDKYYSDPNGLLSQVFRRLFTSRPVLFVGCSLTQDRWVDLLAEVTQEDPSLEHFAIVEYPKTDAQYPARQKILSDHGITPIWFPHGRFEFIQVILEFLATKTGSLPSGSPGGVTSKNRKLRGPKDSILAHETGFYGREDKVTAVLDFLENGERGATVTADPALHSVEGAPGIGKSEICKEALAQYLIAYPGADVYYIELVDARDEAGMLARLADAFGASQAASREQVIASIIANPCVLYLDNLEDVLGNTAAVNFLGLLAKQEAVRVLASSREQLPFLFATTITVDVLDIKSAVQLFLREWDKKTPQYPLEDSHELREFIEQDLGRHALSIVLTAPHGREHQTIARLRVEWRRGAQELAKIGGADGNKDFSLKVSLMRSLAAVEQEMPEAVILWGVLALFPEGMSEGAQNIIFAEQSNQIVGMRDVLTRLNVAYVDTNHNLQMLAPLRQFILEIAKQQDYRVKNSELAELVYPYHMYVIQDAWDNGFDKSHQKTLDTLLSDFPNIQYFMLFASEVGESWATKLSNMSQKLSRFYKIRLQSIIGGVKNDFGPVEILRRLLPLQIEAQLTKDVAVTSNSLAELEEILGDLENACAHYEQAVVNFKKENDNLAVADSLKHLGDLESRLGRIDLARVHYVEAIKIYSG